MNYLGAIILSLVILILGILLFSKNGVSGPEFFNMVTGAALVVAAFYAHRTWRKTEHWKVKKEVFSFLIKKKIEIESFQLILRRCPSELYNFRKPPSDPRVTHVGFSKFFISIQKIHKRINENKSSTEIKNITEPLIDLLISTNISWAREFTSKVNSEMLRILKDEDGFDSIAMLIFELEQAIKLETHDNLAEGHLPLIANEINIRITSAIPRVGNLKLYIDEVIDAIELKLGTSF